MIFIFILDKYFSTKNPVLQSLKIFLVSLKTPIPTRRYISFIHLHYVLIMNVTSVDQYLWHSKINRFIEYVWSINSENV